METRSQHQNFRSRQSPVMVRISHVVTEFISVATGNRHCSSGKLAAIRHTACGRVLGTQRHALGASITDRTRPGYPSRVPRVVPPSGVPLYNL